MLFDGKNLDNKYQGAVMIHQSSQPMFQFHCFVNCAYDAKDRANAYVANHDLVPLLLSQLLKLI